MSLRAGPYALPLRAPFPSARGAPKVRRGFLVRVEGPHGRFGLGDAAPAPPWTEDLKACAAALEEAGHLVRKPVEEPERALDALDARAGLSEAPAARAGIATALLDLAAQSAGEPLAGLLARRAARALDARPVPVNAVVPAWPPAEAAEAARAALREGYRVVKLKLGGTLDEDLGRARAVRGAVGERELRLDANGAWDRKEAERRLGALREVRPAYVEQPLAPTDVEGLRHLRALGLGPVAADEAASGVEGARRVLDAEAADVLIVKPTAAGGPDRAVEVLLEAERRGVPAVVTSLLEGPVGLAMGLHVAALLRERPACGLGTLALFEGRGPRALQVERGVLAVPAGPGLGLGGRDG